MTRSIFIFASAICVLCLTLKFGMATPAWDKVLKPDLARIVKGEGWRVFNRTVTELKENGRMGVRFSGKEGSGVAWLDTLMFRDGTIEFDARGRDVFQKSFIGVAFQAIDDKNYDLVYFRPFNFKSSDPVRRIHAVQYMASPDHDWKKLRAEFPDQYEKAADPAPNADDWFHARIVVETKTVSVFIDKAAKPSLVVEKLTPSRKGKIGFWVGDGSDGAFANLKISAKD